MRTSVSLSDELTEFVEETSESFGENRAEAVRETLRAARDWRDRVDEVEASNDQLRERVDELETELERVREEKRLILEEREEKKELARYAETEREREQQRRQAPVWRRAKWWAFGAPGGEERDRGK